MTSPHWDKVYRNSDSHPWSGVQSWLTKVVSKYHPSPRRALDIGTGEGDKAFWLAEQGYQVLGIDISAVAISKAKKTRTQHRGTSFEIGNLENLHRSNLSADSYGLILDLLTSQFLKSSSLEAYFSTVSNLLAPGGVFIYMYCEAIGVGAPTWVKNSIVNSDTVNQSLPSNLKLEESKAIPAKNLADTKIHSLVARKV